MAKLEEADAEREEHRRIQAEKDRLFKEALEAIAKKSANDLHGLDETKKSLYECHEIKQKEQRKTREERLRQVGRDTSRQETQERLAQAWYNLELNSNAHELEEWCDMCGCLHTIFVVSDDDHQADHQNNGGGHRNNNNVE